MVLGQNYMLCMVDLTSKYDMENYLKKLKYSSKITCSKFRSLVFVLLTSLSRMALSERPLGCILEKTAMNLLRKRLSSRRSQSF